ncbi:MAG: acyl carrier protein [Pseudomonadota bacterium]
MNNKLNIENIITSLIREKDALKDISPDQDFFDFGASSLTIVDLQLQLEQATGLKVPTGQLMINPTINGWLQLYSKTN